MTNDKLDSLIAQHGARKVAIKLVNSKIMNSIGLTMSDLPDTSELCDVIDELEELFDSNYTVQDIKSILDTIDMQFIEDMIYG